MSYLPQPRRAHARSAAGRRVDSVRTAALSATKALAERLEVRLLFAGAAPQLEPLRWDTWYSQVALGADFTDADGGTHTAAVDWGDGTPAQPLLLDEPGLWPDRPNAGGVYGLHDYAGPGAHTVTVTLRDEGGRTSVQAFSALVGHAPGEPLVGPTDPGGETGSLDPDAGPDPVGSPVEGSPGDPTAVAVADVFVAGSTWAADFMSFLAGRGGDAVYGFAAPGQPDELPWSNLDRVSVRFDGPASVDADDLAVYGVNVLRYELDPTAFAYDAATHTATWKLATPVAAPDRLLVDLDGAGTGGADFEFRLDVLPADVNRTGTTNIADQTQIRNRRGISIANPGDPNASPPTDYTEFHDTNGDGVLNVFDELMARAKSGQTLPVGTTPGYPGAPADLTAASRTSTSILLAWAAPSDGVALTYEVYRGGVKLDTPDPAATAFLDQGLSPGTEYTYTVRALTAGENTLSPQSETAPLTAATTGGPGYDVQPPAAPSGLTRSTVGADRATIYWSRPTDDAVSYEVERAEIGEGGVARNAMIVGGTAPSANSLVVFADDFLEPAKTYRYRVRSSDAAGNRSAWAELTATTAAAPAAPGPATPPPPAPGGAASAPHQYVPQAYVDHFYGEMVDVLRDGAARVGIKPTVSARWVDPAAAAPGGGAADNFIFRGADVTLRPATDVVFHDRNGNTRFDDGETVYFPDDTRPAYLNLTAGLHYVDLNNNLSRQDGEPILKTDVYRIEAAAGKVVFYDGNGNGVWDRPLQEALWLDNGDAVYQAGESVVFGQASALPADAWGRRTGLNVAVPDLVGPDGEIADEPLLWQDSGVGFHDDFVGMYKGLEAVAPSFGDGTAAGVPSRPASGTIKVTATWSQYAPEWSTNKVEGVDGSTNFTSQVKAGDYISIGARWYAVGTVTSDTELTLSEPYRPYADGAGLPVTYEGAYRILHWTKIPPISSGTDLTLSAQYGRPTAHRPVFREQFVELQGVLEGLDTPALKYDVAEYDDASSGEFLRVATRAINAARSVFGNGNGAAAELAAKISAGETDPGTRRRWRHVELLQGIVADVSHVTYVASGGEVDGTLWQAALGAGGSGGGPGRPIEGSHLAGLEANLARMQDEGLWVAKGTPSDPGAQYDGYTRRIFSGPADGVGAPAFPSLRDPLQFSDTQVSSQRVISAKYVGRGDDSSGDSGHSSWGGVLHQFLLPNNSNPWGGNALGAIAVNAGAEMSVGGAWDATVTRLQISAEEMAGALRQVFPSAVSLSGDPGTVQVPTYGPVSIAGRLDLNGRLRYQKTESKNIEDVNGTPFVRDWWCEVTITYSLPAIPSLYGEVTWSDNFAHMPLGGPSHASPAPLPGELLPLTTELDLKNAVKDTDQDDVVQVDHDQWSFGNDTGLIDFQPERDAAQVYLPLETRLADGLPVHRYVVQGGFGTAVDSVGSLRAKGSLAGVNADEAGVPFAYSLDTHARINLLLTEGANHVKRVEVVRPRGNAVVFDFQWVEGQGGQPGRFENYGTPAGRLGRDAGRPYVLRDVTPGNDGDLQYELHFASGIVHEFNGGIFKVRDGQGLSAGVAAGNAAVSGERYAFKYNWSRGRLVGVEYTTRGADPQTIRTDIGYAADGASVQSLNKVHVLGAGNETGIPEFSYSVGGGSVSRNGAGLTRSGTAAGGQVTLQAFTPDAPGATELMTTFNTNGLVTSRTAGLWGPGGNSYATTNYDYVTDSTTARYANGIPQWGKVRRVESSDGSWEEFEYEGHGWLRKHVAPTAFVNSDPASTAPQHAVTELFYDPAESGGGDQPKSDDGVERPRKVVTTVSGVRTGTAFHRYSGTSFITRSALPGQAEPTWQAAGMHTGGTAARFDSYKVKSPLGVVDVANGPSSSSVTSGWFGGSAALPAANVVSQHLADLDPFGRAKRSTAVGRGTASYQTASNNAGETDGFGRPLASRVTTGGLVASFGEYGWFGPGKSVGVDDAVTNYAYTGAGWIKTETHRGVQITLDETDPATGQLRVFTTPDLTVTYGHDAAGNVTSVTRAAAGIATVSSSAVYDVRGRLSSATDELGRTTEYRYAEDGQFVTTTVAYPDDTPAVHTDNPTMFVKRHLDGSVHSVGGAAAVPASYDYGVDAGGATWVRVSRNGGREWVKDYYDALGRHFKSERPGPTPATGEPPVVAATTEFDGNGRPFKSTGFDGTVTLTDYDPVSGLVLSTVLDADRDGTFTPGGGDRKALYHHTAAPASPAFNVDAGTYRGTLVTVLGQAGSTKSESVAKDGGLTARHTGNDLVTTTEVSYPAAHQSAVTTTLADGTQVEESYAGGLLWRRRKLGVAEGGGDRPEVWAERFDYDALRRHDSTTDWVGTTTLALRADGSVGGGTLPDGRRTWGVPEFEARTNAPEEAVRPDGESVLSTYNGRVQLTSRAGAGVLPARFDYDDATGRLTGLRTYRAGVLPPADGGPTSDEALTQWGYDPATGLMTSKTYADGSVEGFGYNAKLQLADVTRPGGLAGAFLYNSATGELDRSTYQLKDAQERVVGEAVTSVLGRDDKGRSLATSQRVDGTTTTTAAAYDAKDRLAADYQGGTRTVYAYYTATEAADPATGGTAVDGALKSVTLVRGATPLLTYLYKYDPVSKRLKTVTAVGKDFTYGYHANSDAVVSLTGGSVATAWDYEDGEGGAGGEDRTGRLKRLSATTSSGQTLHQSAYTFHDNDQRATQAVTRRNPDGTDSAFTLGYAYDGLDQLTGVTSTAGGPPAATYLWDGAGNRTDLGAVDALNQYASLDYDARGNLTGDGTFAYAYDVLDRLSSAETVVRSDQAKRVEFEYDADGRRTVKRSYTWNATHSAWVLAKTLKFAYDGLDLVAEFETQPDHTDKLVRSYAWGIGMGGGVGGLLAVTDHTPYAGPKAYVPLFDGSGNVVGLADADTGAVAATYQYDAFGKLLAESGPAAAMNPFRHATQFYDAETGLSWYDPGRYYHPVLRRWLTRDPSGEAGGLNLYVFNENDPVNKHDPHGMAPERSDQYYMPGTVFWGGRPGSTRPSRLSDEMPIGLESAPRPPRPQPQQFPTSVLPDALFTASDFIVEWVVPRPDQSAKATVDQWNVMVDPSQPAMVRAGGGFGVVGNGIFTVLDVLPIGGKARREVAERIGRKAAGVLEDKATRRMHELIEIEARRGLNESRVSQKLDEIAGASSNGASNAQSTATSLLDRIVTDANRVSSPNGLVTDAQLTILRQNLPVIQRRSAAQNRVLRDEFVRDQSRHMGDWAAHTGRVWPTGATPHHIIPLESGGANAWWNLMPTHGSLPNHSLPGISGPHAAGGVLRDTIQQGRRTLPPGTTTDLRRP